VSDAKVQNEISQSLFVKLLLGDPLMPLPIPRIVYSESKIDPDRPCNRGVPNPQSRCHCYFVCPHLFYDRPYIANIKEKDQGEKTNVDEADSSGVAQKVPPVLDGAFKNDGG
jgi:hypothetical protein